MKKVGTNKGRKEKKKRLIGTEKPVEGRAYLQMDKPNEK